MGDGNNAGKQVIWDDESGKMVVSDNGSRVDYYEGSTHSYSTYDKSGNLTGGGVGETHPHEHGNNSR